MKEDLTLAQQRQDMIDECRDYYREINTVKVLMDEKIKQYGLYEVGIPSRIEKNIKYPTNILVPIY